MSDKSLIEMMKQANGDPDEFRRLREEQRKLDALKPPFVGHANPERHRTVGHHRSWCDCGEWCYPTLPCGCCDEPRREQVDEEHPIFLAAINRVLDLHRPVIIGDSTWEWLDCVECVSDEGVAVDWPCETIRALCDWDKG
jgi:hypothetical protein